MRRISYSVRFDLDGGPLRIDQINRKGRAAPRRSTDRKVGMARRQGVERSTCGQARKRALVIAIATS